MNHHRKSYIATWTNGVLCAKDQQLLVVLVMHHITEGMLALGSTPFINLSPVMGES